METTQNKEKRYLVLDTSAFIKETRFEKFESSELFTVDEVLKEVRDKKARKYLSSIPFRIQTREPTPDAIQAVIDFSKKTGDYTSLSATDISVIALTYTFEKENYGSKNIRTEPTKVILRLICDPFFFSDFDRIEQTVIKKSSTEQNTNTQEQDIQQTNQNDETVNQPNKQKNEENPHPLDESEEYEEEEEQENEENEDEDDENQPNQSTQSNTNEPENEQSQKPLDLSNQTEQQKSSSVLFK